MCAEPFPRAGLPVYLDTVMCAVFALLPFPSSPFPCLSGVFLFGFGLVFFPSFCVPNMRFFLLVLLTVVLRLIFV